MLLISVLFLATAVEAQPWGGGRQLAKAKPCETACMNGARRHDEFAALAATLPQLKCTYVLSRFD